MAISVNMAWYIRAGGNVANGGGYDSSVSSPGTNYADQDAAQVILDGSTITASNGGASATVTVSGYSTAATDVGNVVRISAGTNFIAGYYTIVSQGTGTWTFDRNCTTGAGSGMVGRMGGAQPHFTFLAGPSACSGGSGTAVFCSPTIATPLVAGNTIWLRGAGSDDPSTVDYAFGSGYWSMPDAAKAGGSTRIIGYNGRPFISSDNCVFYSASGWHTKNIKYKAIGATYANYGYNGGSHGVEDCIFDQAGNDVTLVKCGGNGGTGSIGGGSAVINCEFRNSGSTAAGTKPVIDTLHVSSLIFGNYFHDLKGPAIKFHGGTCGHAAHNIIANCHADGIYVDNDETAPYHESIHHNTIYNCTGHGIYVNTSGCAFVSIFNNLITHNAQAGKAGIYMVGTAATNANTVRSLIGYNNFFGNTADVTGWTMDSTDTTLDPGYKNAAGGDFSVGPALSNRAFPTGLLKGSATKLNLTPGAAQRKEVGGSNLLIGV
jgi:hypothetical protein